MRELEFPKVIIFDLDDTIIDFHKGIVPSWKTACATYCEHFQTIDKDVLYHEIRETGKVYWSDSERHRIGRNNLLQARREIVYMAFKNLGLTSKTDAYHLADHYSDLRIKSLCLLPGALETLDTFKAMGQQMVLLTNGESSLQRAKIRTFQLEHFFKEIFVEGEVGVGKPDVKAYFNCLNTLSLKPEEVWMVGDNLEWDVYAPQSIGIFSIWHDYNHTGLPESSVSTPDRIINSLPELLH